MIITRTKSSHSRSNEPTFGGARARGFTLVELMVVVAVAAILASIAMPAYTAYVQRSRVPPALAALLSYHVRMEMRFQDVGSYSDDGACAIAPPTADNFNVTCTASDDGSAFTATATGVGRMAGFTYTIDNKGTRTTVAHPRGVPGDACWSVRGGSCEG